jgi:hypothetical protein
MKRTSINLILITLMIISIIPISTGAEQSDKNTNTRFIVDPPPDEGDPPPNWEFMDTLTTEVFIKPGEKFYIYFDNQTNKLKAMDIPKLTDECYQALDLVPEWIKNNLTFKLSQLSANDQTTYANLIINSPDSKYIDEIAFCIAHSSIDSLKHTYTFPDLLTDNAKYIYKNDQYLSYVTLVEKSDYTTISYKNKTGVSLEVPRDIYYWYVVHPKVSDELATYVDPDYDYTKHSPGNRNYGVSPPTGKFWREWFFYHNDTGQNISHPGSNKTTYKSNPLLKDLLANATDIWNAISKVNNWISNSMIFNSNNERPIQPVRIYRKHMGRCGEHQDMRAAAARAGLIPVACTLNSAEDHVWNEFWDQRWIHWDGDKDNPMKYENGWGKKISSVWNCRGDGYIWSVTDRYSQTCTFTATVLDSSGEPVDGAEVWALTENYYDPDYLTITTWGITDYTGKCTIELGDSRNYWSCSETDQLGEDPADSQGNEIVTPVITNSGVGNSYTHTFNLPDAAPKLKAETAMPPEVPSNNMKLEIDYKVKANILQGVHIQTGEHFDYYGPSGDIDFFITDSENYNEYNKSRDYYAFDLNERGISDTIDFIAPSDDSWYAVLSNEFSQSTTKIVEFSVEVYGKLTGKIVKPIDESELELDSTIKIKGTAFSPISVSTVEIDIDDSGTWIAAVDSSMDGELSWTHWEFDWATIGLEPGKHQISARIKDSKASFVTTIEVILKDVTLPKVMLDTPQDKSIYKIGEIIPITGTITDNVGISRLELNLDPDTEEIIDIMDHLIDDKLQFNLDTADILDGEHSLMVAAYDTSENMGNVTISLTLLESVRPVVSIIEPLNNSYFEKGSVVEISGKATDNKKVTHLEVVIDENEPIDITSSLSKSGYWEYEWFTNEDTTSEGVHRIDIIASDEAENKIVNTIFISLDGTPPIVNITLPIQGSIINSGSEIILEGYVIEEIGVQKLELSIGNFDPIDILENLGYSKWRYTLDNSKNLPGGENKISVKITDFVGLEHESEIEIFIDKERPTINIDEFVEPILIGITINFQGTASDDIGIRLIDLFIHEDYIGNLSIPISSENSDWSYSWNITGYSEGDYEITARVTDLVGKSNEEVIILKLISKFTDTDSDGMPDWWELLYDKLDWTKNDAARDYDQDGFSNLEEYLGDDGVPDNDDYSDPMDSSLVPNIKDEKTSDPGTDLTGVWIGLLITVILILIILFMFLRVKSKGAESKAEVEDTKRQQETGSQSTEPSKPTQIPFQPQMQQQPQMPAQIPLSMQMQGYTPGPVPIPPGPMPPMPSMPSIPQSPMPTGNSTSTSTKNMQISINQKTSNDNDKN